jgi:hypothetical protein
VLVSLALATPLLLHFREYPEDAAARSNVVSIFASELGQVEPLAAFGQNLLLNLGMFTWRGDDTVRHNLPYRPVFDLLVAPFFLLGVPLSLRALIAGRAAGWFAWPDRPSGGALDEAAGGPAGGPGRLELGALWLWLGTMALPGLLSDSAPHFLRSIGLLPALFALPALGLMAAAAWLRQRFGAAAGGPRAATLPLAALGLVLAGSQLLTWWDYFARLPREPELGVLFDAPRAELARVAGDPPPGLDLALPTPGWSYATIRFLRPRSFDPPRPGHAAQARFDRHVALLGYDLEPDPLRPDRAARLTLYWRALRELNASYVRGARIVDRYGRVWWETRGEPGSGTLPTDTWAPGEVVADRVAVALNPGTPPGEYELELSLAQPGGGRRLPVYDGSGRQTGSTLKLPSLRVERER